MSASKRGIGVGRATLLAVLSVLAFVLALTVVYGTTGDPGSRQGVPNTATTTTPTGS